MAKRRKPAPGRPVRPRRTPAPPPQVGRRPSRTGLLLVTALMWMGAGTFILVAGTASWRLVPGVVAIGIGLYWLRGASATIVRREERRGR